jgi:hypothetical protein
MVIRDDGTSKTRVQWYCSGLTTGKNNIFRDRPYDCDPKSDTNYVTTHIRFPQCGAVNPDGSVNGDLVYAGSGGCPKDHPHVFPRLSLAVKYDTPLGANSRLATAADDTDSAHADPGTGFHADYFEAWKPNAALANNVGTADALQYFIDHCIKAGIDCRDGDRLP